MSYDARILRDRQEAAAAADARSARFAEDGALAVLVQTRTLSAYPTVANTYFACSPVAMDGPESEGAAASFTADPSRTIFVYNLGEHVPPVGARLIAHSCSGRWTFRFEG